MLRQKEKCFHPRTVSLEELVPADHFYRALEANLDLSYVYELVKDTYAPTMGRPSIDPVVFFRLQLIMFFEGIRSERQLMQTVNVNLAHRWYLGYDLEEAVPDHSSLSKIRSRYGLGVFQKFFEKVVGLCQAAGLVWGKELYFDGSKVRANAAIDGLMPREPKQVKEHLNALFPPNFTTKKESQADTASVDGTPGPDTWTWLVHKYDGTRRNEKRTSSYARTTDVLVSPTDADASPMRHYPGNPVRLGYHLHYVVDGGAARIILATLVTPASVMDNIPMLDLAHWVRTRWKVQPEIAVGDTKYGTIANIVGLEKEGIRAYPPMTDFSRRSGFYPAERFHYDAERDLYICPQGQALTRYSQRQREEVVLYRAKSKVCNRCPVKAECTSSRSGRYIFRSFFQAEIERVQAYAQTEEYKKALRKRQVWVEPLFGEAKQWHQATRFRLRRLRKVNIQGLLTATGQNLKRWLQWKEARKIREAANGSAILFLWILEIEYERPYPRCVLLFQQADRFCDDIGDRNDMRSQANRGGTRNLKRFGEMNRPEQDQTVIDLQNLQAGLEWWRRRSSGWPADLHNREYYGIYEAREAGVTVDWWTATVDRLARWNALRTPVAGNTKAEILSRGKPLLDILSKLYANLILISKGEPLILSLEWVYAEPFFKLASSTKITSRPVFAAKMCHFLFPRLFISMDNRATGIFEYHTFWKEMRSEWDRLGKDERTVLIRTLEDAIDSDEPRHPLYPIETKIMELCRIGRTHRGDPVE